MFKPLVKNQSGLVMIIVLTLSFIVLLTISIIVTLVLSNLESLSGQNASFKVNNSMVLAMEKLRGGYKVYPSLFESCAAGDCLFFDANKNDAPSCVSCSSLQANLKLNKYKIYIDSLTPPDRHGPTIGSANLVLSGYYNNFLKEKTLSFCLNYCSVAGYNCGDDGCGGSCGTCLAPQTCGGGGQAGVCGQTAATSCTDINLECDANCVNGDTCGGGKVIDSKDHIIAYDNGCETGCDSQARWDAAPPSTTNATSQTDGRYNASAIPDDVRYDASYICRHASYYGFSGWYLPALNELSIMNTANENGWSTGYNQDCYWSSTELDDYNGYISAIGNPPFACGSGEKKNSGHYVRCLRRY